jgi:thiol-disulfide isomerase/thioredoxin
MSRDWRRREVLALTAGAGATAALAGCLGGGDSSGDSGGGVEDWRTVELEDVTSGEQFTVAGIDEPVFVHPFAVWCSTCKRQNDELDSFQQTNDREVVQLNIGAGENTDDVTEYARQNGYAPRARFAVAPSGVSGALADEFGPAAVSPPQSPVILVCPDGTTAELSKQADSGELADAIDTNCG